MERDLRGSVAGDGGAARAPERAPGKSPLARATPARRASHDEANSSAPAPDDPTRGGEIDWVATTGVDAPTMADVATATIEGRGTGAPVDGQIAARVGGHLGADLSGVRVHQDPMASAANAALGARAFAHGSDVFLGAGESATDLPLLAHELTHVAQQGAAAPAPARKVEVGAADSPAEREADRVAEEVVGGAPPVQRVVDDGPVAPGQMLRSTFLAELREVVTAAADAELGPELSAVGCPYIDAYFQRYATRSSADLEAVLRRFAPATRAAPTAAAMIPLIVVRVRDGVRQWRDAGTVPPDVASLEPEAARAAATTAASPGQALRAPDGRETLASLEADLGPGRPLDGGTAHRMSEALGRDVGTARLHSGPVAAAKAEAAGAQAFAVGPHVVLGDHAPAVGTLEGDALLAHELAHTAQQGEAARSLTARHAPIDAESGAAEDQADRAAAGAVTALHGDAGQRSLLRRFTDWVSSGLRLQRCSGGVAPTYRAQAAVGPDVGRRVAVSHPAKSGWYNHHELSAGETVGVADDEPRALALAKTLGRDLAIIPGDGRYFLYAITGGGDLDLDRVYGQNAGIQIDAGVLALVHRRGLTYFARDLAVATPATMTRAAETADPNALSAYQALNQDRGGLEALSEPELIATFQAALFDTALITLQASEVEAQRKATQWQTPGATSADEHATVDATARELLPLQRQIEDTERDLRAADVQLPDVPGTSVQVAPLERKLKDLREQKRKIVARYPMLGRFGSADALAGFIAKKPDEREAALAKGAHGVLADIATTREHVLTGDLNLWTLPPLVEATIAGLGLGKDSPQRDKIAAKASAQGKKDAFWNLALGVFSLGLGLAAAVATGGLSVALTAGAVGLGAYDAITTTEQYYATNAAANTDLDPDGGLLPAEARMHWGWLVVAWAGVALDFADVLKAARIASEVEQVARGARSIDEAAAALAQGDQRILDRLRRAAGQGALTDTVTEATRPGLAARIGAELVVDGNLGKDVQVIYELSGAGTRVVHVRVGPAATTADVLAHTDTIAMLNRYEGALGRLRQLWDRLRSFAGMGRAGTVPFERGSQAFESWHELEKLQTLIGYRRAALAEMLAKSPSPTAAQISVRKELDFLENEVDRHRRVVEAAVGERGAGLIAMSDATRDALASGHHLPDFPGKTAADLTADELQRSAYYFERNADGTFALQQKVSRATPAPPTPVVAPTKLSDAMQHAKSVAGERTRSALQRFILEPAERAAAEAQMRPLLEKTIAEKYDEVIAAGGDVKKARTEANKVAAELSRAEALKAGVASAEAKARQAVATGTSIDVSKLDPDSARQLASYQTGVFEAQRLAPKLVDKSEAEFLSLMAEEVAQGRVPPPRRINIGGPPPQPMSMWEYPDGTVVRYKPLGDSERPIAFSIEVKADPKVPDSGRESAAFKVERTGLAVPRSDFSSLNPYNVATHPDQYKAFDHVVMRLAHHGLTR